MILDPLKPKTSVLGGGQPVQQGLPSNMYDIAGGGPTAIGQPAMSSGLPPMPSAGKPTPGPTLGGPGPRPANPAGPDMGIPGGAQSLTQQPASATSPYAPPSPSGGGRTSPNPSQLAGFENFANAAYGQATRRLDPQFEQADSRFQQQMVNKGLSEGTEAYDKARANFSMDKNDAYGQARSQALAQALAAQGQAFGQQFQDRSLSQQNSQFGQNLGYQYAGLNENNRQFNNSLAEQGRQFNGNLGQRESEFGRNFGFQGERADMSDLMALLGYGQNTNANNNQSINSDFNRAGGLFGLVPGMSPVSVDVMSPYQMQQQQNQFNASQAQSGANGLFGAIGQIGAAALPLMMPSDRRIKTDISRVGTLDNGLPVYLFRYRDGGPMQIGLMAQDVQEVKPEAVGDFDGILAVDYAKAVQ
jgi:hypothetical protein